MSLKFVKHKDFPQANAEYLPSGWFWKMNVREWAFAELHVAGVTKSMKGNSNNPIVIPGHGVGASDLKTNNPGTGTATLRFYAASTGLQPGTKYPNHKDFSLLYMFDQNPGDVLQNTRMQVEVKTRRSAQRKDISPAKLSGKRFAMNAPDIKSYTMDTTVTFSGGKIDPLTFFNAVKAGTNHIAIASHGGHPNGADRTQSSQMCILIAGQRDDSNRLDLSNVEAVFKTLKGKVAENCVIWFGNCKIGANNDFCKTAATASGCYVIAPTVVLSAQAFKLGEIDLIDRLATPKVWKPDGTTINMSEFCAIQDSLKFSVPV